MIQTKMSRWRQAAGNHSKNILYPLPRDYQHIGAGSCHYKSIHLIEDYAMNANK